MAKGINISQLIEGGEYTYTPTGERVLYKGLNKRLMQGVQHGIPCKPYEFWVSAKSAGFNLGLDEIRLYII